eukprot:scaffold3037_cov230-Pinguiococcus_pyrenoidosus.AAC.3
MDFPFPRGKISLIIGPGGSTIRRLSADHSVRLLVPGKDAPRGHVELEGEIEDVFRCLRELMRVVFKTNAIIPFEEGGAHRPKVAGRNGRPKRPEEKAEKDAASSDEQREQMRAPEQPKQPAKAVQQPVARITKTLVVDARKLIVIAERGPGRAFVSKLGTHTGTVISLPKLKRAAIAKAREAGKPSESQEVADAAQELENEDPQKAAEGKEKGEPCDDACNAENGDADGNAAGDAGDAGDENGEDVEAAEEETEGVLDGEAAAKADGNLASEDQAPTSSEDVEATAEVTFKGPPPNVEKAVAAFQRVVNGEKYGVVLQSIGCKEVSSRRKSGRGSRKSASKSRSGKGSGKGRTGRSNRGQAKGTKPS